MNRTQSKFKKARLVVLAGFLFAIPACVTPPQNEVANPQYDIVGTDGFHAVRRHKDAELGVVCYTYAHGISCIQLKEVSMQNTNTNETIFYK